MASTVIDGLVLPVSLAVHPVLDFCNTRAAWAAPVPKEYLESHAHLAVWAGANGFLPAPEVTALRRGGARAAGAGRAAGGPGGARPVPRPPRPPRPPRAAGPAAGDTRDV